MHVTRGVIAALILFASLSAAAQQSNQVQLNIESSNRTLTVSAQERVTAEPEIAVLHIGFETPPSDAKQAYAVGSKASNQIIAAIKQAGIVDAAIRSESQRLESTDFKAHKFRLVQSWVVKVPPVRAAEILDLAVNSGATDSGRIDWTVEDEEALENKALEKAAARARADAEVLARGMGVQLTKLVYATNQIATSEPVRGYALANFSAELMATKAPTAPLAIEPHKVSRTASVYAVYSIE
jgi:uncharacterized protein